MGFILSKFWRKKTTLDILQKIENDLTKIRQYKQDTQSKERKILRNTITYGVALFIIAAVVAYFKFWQNSKNVNDKLIILLPFLFYVPLLVILRRFLTWHYHRKNRNNDKKLQDLLEKKSKILEEVMEKETYKTAKDILEKFDPARLNRPIIGAPLSTTPRPPLKSGLPPDLRQRKPPNETQAPPGSGGGGRPLPNLNQTLPITSTSSKPNAAQPGAGGDTATPPSQLGRDRPGLPMVLQGRGAHGPPLPRPVLPREKGYLDKFVDYLVGDGPSNRYALICRQCQSHNGMALREEFEYIAYRCCYCYYWNPARKQRPVAPRLPDPTVSRGSSTAESSRSSSLAGSRRSSQDGVVEVVTSQESVSSDQGDNDEVNDGLDEKEDINDEEVEEDRAVTTDEENNETVQEVFESREDSEPNVESEHSEDNHDKIDETKQNDLVKAEVKEEEGVQKEENEEKMEVDETI